MPHLHKPAPPARPSQSSPVTTGQGILTPARAAKVDQGLPKPSPGATVPDLASPQPHDRRVPNSRNHPGSLLSADEEAGVAAYLRLPHPRCCVVEIRVRRNPFDHEFCCAPKYLTEISSRMRETDCRPVGLVCSNRCTVMDYLSEGVSLCAIRDSNPEPLLRVRGFPVFTPDHGPSHMTALPEIMLERTACLVTQSHVESLR
jgi:hypothetical protein